MKKLIISNFIFLLLLNLFLVTKEYLFITYNLNSGFEDFTYPHIEAQGSFGFGVFSVSVWWILYLLLFSIVSAFAFKYIENKINRLWLLVLLVLLQILLCYFLNKLILMNIFGYVQPVNILISSLSTLIFWYIIIYKRKN